MKQRKQYDDDDGRVIANMDVDGMPWYLRRAYRKPTGEDARENLTRAERGAMIRGVLAAALLIFAVLVIGILLFILFAEHVWFS